ncbi:MAG TPA: hypothetical protein VFH60_11820 [Chloroflexia bacterium]|nr:hypothetical protein [Chloroflexia bacterium]
MKVTYGSDANNESRAAAFYRHTTIEDLAKQQGVEPVTDPSMLAGDFWPEDETAEEFIATLRQWRNEEDSRSGGNS